MNINCLDIGSFRGLKYDCRNTEISNESGLLLSVMRVSQLVSLQNTSKGGDFLDPKR